jgi:hypothetical protein
MDMRSYVSILKNTKVSSCANGAVSFYNFIY